MSKRFPIYALAALAAAVALVVAGAASASSAKPHVFKTKVVNIVMADPGCHWFADGAKHYTSASVARGTTFRNLDEAALVFKGAGISKHVAVGKTLTIAKAGTYHITMVGQAPDDNHLLLVVK
jgi:hypothetical protein